MASADPLWSVDVEDLTQQIVGASPPAELEQLARRVAEAHIDVRRVRLARHQFLSNALVSGYYEPRENTREKINVLCRLLAVNAQEVPFECLENYLTSMPEGAEKLAIILSRESKILASFDRYERRARSRRKSAIRALDEARSLPEQSVD
jgi:hypothetical protein